MLKSQTTCTKKVKPNTEWWSHTKYKYSHKNSRTDNHKNSQQNVESNVKYFQANFLAKDKRRSPRSNGLEIMTIWSESWICSTWLGGLFLIIQSWNSFINVLSFSDTTKIRFTDPYLSGVSTRLVSISSLLNKRCGRTNAPANSTSFKSYIVRVQKWLYISREKWKWKNYFQLCDKFCVCFYLSWTKVIHI